MAASGLDAGCSQSACAAAAGCALRRRCRRSARRGGRVLGAPRRPGAAAARAAGAAGGFARRPTDAALLGGLPGPLAVPSRPPHPLPLLLCPRPCPPPCLSCPRSPAGRPWPIRPSPPPRSLRTSRTASRSRPLTPRQDESVQPLVPGRIPPDPRSPPGRREQTRITFNDLRSRASGGKLPRPSDRGSGYGAAARGINTREHANGGDGPPHGGRRALGRCASGTEEGRPSAPGVIAPQGALVSSASGRRRAGSSIVRAAGSSIVRRCRDGCCGVFPAGCWVRLKLEGWLGTCTSFACESGL